VLNRKFARLHINLEQIAVSFNGIAQPRGGGFDAHFEVTMWREGGDAAARR
jgi:hypothetical protein